MNTSGIYPLEYNVLVAPKKVEEKTAGGIILPDDNREKEQYGQTEGTLVAVSPAAFTFNYEGWPENHELPQVGDRVFFSRYQATEVKGTDGETYWLMKDKSLAGVMK
jgi:chaperonin GroES